MSDSGICYTWSGDKKIYEPDLFSAQLFVSSKEYCFRYDSNDSKTLVFGKNSGLDSDIDEFNAYLPHGGLSINHNIQDNGEDHYSLSGTYTKPQNWSPPAGVDGPFDSSVGLKYPYYIYTIAWADQVSTWYNDKFNLLDIHSNNDVYFYGNKKINLDPFINYYVTFTLNSGMLNCKCNSVTNIPGTNNGNVTLGINVQLGDGKGAVVGGRDEWFQFSWVMKNGIDESKSCSVPYYLGSGFTTQSSWESDNGDGTKTYYTFHINHDSIPSPPNSKSL